MVWIWPSGDLRSVSRVFQWSCVYCVTQSRNPHRTLKDKAVSDSMFHPVSSSNWESFVLSAESQARGGGGGIGGMTQKTFFYKNVAYQIVMYFFFSIDKFVFNIFIDSFSLCQSANGGLRRVLFRSQPDVLYLTLQGERAAATLSPPDSRKEDKNEETLSATHRQLDTQTCHKYKRGPR